MCYTHRKNSSIASQSSPVIEDKSSLNLTPSFNANWDSFLDNHPSTSKYLHSDSGLKEFTKACEHLEEEEMNFGVDIDLCGSSSLHFATNGISNPDIAFDIVLLNDSLKKPSVVSSITLELLGSSLILRSYGEYSPPAIIPVNKNAEFDFSTFPQIEKDYRVFCSNQRAECLRSRSFDVKVVNTDYRIQNCSNDKGDTRKCKRRRGYP